MARPASGTIVEIKLADGHRAFGRLLQSPVIEFFAQTATSTDVVNIERLLISNRAFTIYVRATWPKVLEWQPIARQPLTIGELEHPPVFCLQDMISKQLSRYWENPRTGEHFREPASFEECEGLEVAAVWEPEHVLERLEDHAAGRPNIHAARMRPTPTGED